VLFSLQLSDVDMEVVLAHNKASNLIEEPFKFSDLCSFGRHYNTMEFSYQMELPQAYHIIGSWRHTVPL